MDKLSQFSSAQNVFTGTPLTIVSTFAYDLLAGAPIATTPGTYTLASALPVIIGNATTFGMDFGIGSTSPTPHVVGEAIQAFAGGTSVQVQFVGQADPNTGTLGTWVIYGQTDTIATSLLTANTRIFGFDWPQRKIGAALPRFVALRYVVAGTMTAGTITADNVIGGSDDALGTLQQYPANFTVAA